MNDRNFYLITTLPFEWYGIEMDMAAKVIFDVHYWGHEGSRDEPPVGPEFSVRQILIEGPDYEIEYKDLDPRTQDRLDNEIADYICNTLIWEKDSCTI